jgi:protein TonB
MPVVVRKVHAQYTPNAMRERVAGSVKLRCVVDRQGAPTAIEVVESLHPELDESAVNAMKQWQFRPGARGGTPVAVRIHVEMTFTLKS